ncbi:hypothetical protein [Methanocaldococcus fervens]|uniref:DUF4352 domain-containing protein n=1 Tax=Methanocaldococcus fervens (strain DSM 4213 / JCM 15782 / AG86) TaxID=573064 RepID=C7P5G1_METFA|nr:hypothetical protein [Methanocaldococcus fervens]ACV25339.1 hypothetical protein Mefer_1536 [Methanocaldococcus fervens AG86]
MKRLLFFVIFVIAILLCGCTTNKTANVNNGIDNIEANKTLDETKLKEIKYMYIVKEGNKTKIQFALAYGNGSLARVDNGKVAVEVFDDTGLLFKKSYDVKNLPIKANYYYEVELPRIKGFYSDAKFVLTFEDDDVKPSKTTYGTIERYSAEEMKEIFEKEYHENSIKTNIEEVRDDIGIKFIVKEYGYYKIYNNRTDEIEERFRVDFAVKNLNPDTYKFVPKEICLVSGDEKYWKIEGVDELEIGINQEAEGYWIFKKPDSTEDLRLNFKIGDLVFDIKLSQE